ncbi:hypothetical protein Tco_0892736 [Tanacetum coccineum]|uniref:Uncharacterized protein n=1 Tax=Tanacetum coccineum TaxID=301880 RepID=A0ABQ5CC46_9ASTR
MVRVKMPRCMAWLGSTDACDEHISSLGMMKNEVGNTSPQGTSQILPLFEEYTSPTTYLEEVKETLGTPMEVEPLDQTKLEDVGLDTCNHDIPLSSREVPSFDEPNPQPQPLPSCPSLDVSLGDERGPEPPIKPHSPDSFRIKVVDNLTIHTPPSSHMASFHPKDVYYYYHPCIDDPKKYYGFKPGRKAHLLEDKQISSVDAFDEVSFYTLFRAFVKHLKEKHVTWARFEKKQDKNTTFGLSVRGDGIRICGDAVRSEGRRRHHDL